MTNQWRLFITLMLLPLFSMGSDLFNNKAAHQLTLNAYIPDRIEITGLPGTIDLTMSNGQLLSPPVYFQVNRSGANVNEPKQFSIALSSSAGQSNNNFFLLHDHHSDEKLSMNVHFRTRGDNGSGQVFTAGNKLYETTVTEPGERTASQSKKVSIIIKNDNQHYLAAKRPGLYTANYILTVSAI